MPAQVDHRRLYRLPWSLTDNPISWLEPTDFCNLRCDGCYRHNVLQHKTIEQIESDLNVFEQFRTFDGVSIAGGDPLTHPDVVEIVRCVARRGVKPILNTNGHALTEKLLKELKAAGLFGFTFHVDSKQGRPGWEGKDEEGMNELRSQYARMVAEVGGIACAFNSTVYPDTLEQVPQVLEWARREIAKVQTVVFILFRHGELNGNFDYYAGGEKVDISPLVYSEKTNRPIDTSALDVVQEIRKQHPQFAPCAYLNGTAKPDSFKWLLSLRIGSQDRIFGYAGAKWIELVQSAHHWFTNRYLSYTSPKYFRHGRAVAALGSLVDGGFRKAAREVLKEAVQSPSLLAQRAYLQAVMIIQPIDILEDGGQNMCDGCPDMTVENGKLVWSCRLEEPRKYGSFLRTVPRQFISSEQSQS